MSRNSRPTGLSATRILMSAPVLANATDMTANDRPPKPENTSSVSVRSQLIARNTTLPIAAAALIAQTAAAPNRPRVTIWAILSERGPPRQPH